MNIRPEHVHYDTVEQWIRQCLAQGHSTLFDPILFDIELRRLSEEYNFPYEVRLVKCVGIEYMLLSYETHSWTRFPLPVAVFLLPKLSVTSY
jgi:hypothetical protein